MALIKDYDKLKRILENFKISGELTGLKPIDNGIINTTYVAEFDDEGKKRRFLLQKINTSIFSQPYRLMKNIENVTNYMKSEQTNGQAVLSVIETNDGASLYKDKDSFSQNEFYRVYNYIDGTVTYNQSTDSEVVYNTGKAFGNFQRVLNDYPMQLLYETIENFHNTKKRYQDFLASCQSDALGRRTNAQAEINTIVSHANDYSLIVDLLDEGKIPLRVTHNDTKVNNVLMNPVTGEPVAVVDLDTVMPGSGLYDYGDGIRSTCSTALEDEKDLSKVSINMELFKAYTDGFLSEMAPFLKEAEINNMVTAIKIITLELSMRFLGDYLNGDVYFKTNYQEHNLVRARNQLKLVLDIELKEAQMRDYIAKSYRKNVGETKLKKL